MSNFRFYFMQGEFSFYLFFSVRSCSCFVSGAAIGTIGDSYPTVVLLCKPPRPCYRWWYSAFFLGNASSIILTVAPLRYRREARASGGTASRHHYRTKICIELLEIDTSTRTRFRTQNDINP